ncbi:GNAT family N-acetyltransferase [Actibacterium ureilyticum]|uniref:GNAT family N-acetyltransferase n=1 Tax=Actibacterium ureilyticum TaxID=1590614 RepID=UPI000BAACCC1|nr:GNAT family N-acetyltransferase [Actibacterium ureilyticum]
MQITLTIPELETERLILRGPKAADWEADAEFRTSDRAQFVGGPFTRMVAWRNFASRWGHWAIHGYGMFTVTERGSDAALGVVGPLYPDGWTEPELGWVLYEQAEGRGIAFEAAQAVRRYAYDVLGWTTAISYIDAANQRSRALAERLGCHAEPGAAHPFEDADIIVYRHPKPEVC